ncbi:MAG: ABC transporter ATP-binding protein [Desulfuromonadaceae bacterium]|nr:ABC transporter ATP-binding protein [Desulfuromonadaceae bacterium]
MIAVRQMSFAYGRRWVLQRIDLDVRPGELLTIMGANGCGKSTLLRLLRGRLRPQQGEVCWSGGAAHDLGRDHMARLVAVVPQQLSQPFAFPVREMVAMGRYVYQKGLAGVSHREWQIVEESLAQTDASHLADRCCSELSGGELQRVLLARALAQQAPVLMLDEATSQLDLGHKRSIAALLRRLCQDERKTIVQVSHDLNSAAEISQRILLLAPDGARIALDAPDRVLNREVLREAFGVEVDVVRHPASGQLRIFPQPLECR